MPIRDLATKINPDITASSGDIVDTRLGYSLTYLTHTKATTTLTFLEGDDSALSDSAAVSVDDLIIADSDGTKALNVVTYTDAVTACVGYVGKKRYVKMTVANAATDTTIVTIKGDLLFSPVN
jgi:hypothetical protein